MFALAEQNHINDIWSSDPYDIYKDKNGTTVLEFALVGFDNKDISVSVSGQTLKVEAIADQQTKNEEKADINIYTYHKKISRRSIKKQFTLHDNVDKDNIEAVYKNGLLTITIPLEKEEKRDIMIKVK
jgi:HSP20 family protein